jgi:hypothetical protein
MTTAMAMNRESTALELRLDFGDTIELRAELEAHLVEARVHIEKAKELAARVGCDFDRLTYDHRRDPNFFCRESPVPHVMKFFDAAAWDRFYNASGVSQFMSESARGEWRTAIYELNVGPLTAENVKATFAALMERSSEFLVDGLVAVARSISWNHATNTPHMVTPRLILKAFYTRGSISETSAGTLDDLDRCLRVIAGKDDPPLDSSLWRRRLPYAAPRFGQVLAGKYFDVKIYSGAGTCHLSFKDEGLELLPQLNRLLATRYPSTLPPSGINCKKKGRK